MRHFFSIPTKRPAVSRQRLCMPVFDRQSQPESTAPSSVGGLHAGDGNHCRRNANGRQRASASIGWGMILGILLTGTASTTALSKDFVRLSITAAPSTVWIGETITIELQVSIRLAPTLPAGHEPLHPEQPAFLIVPWLRVNGLPGLASPDITPLLASRSMPHGQQPTLTLALDLPACTNDNESQWPVRLDRRLRPSEGDRWMSYSLETYWRPSQPGRHIVDPIQFVGHVPVEGDADGRVTRWIPVTALSEPQTVHVLPIPTDSKHRQFIAKGAGLTVDARLSSHTVRLDEALSLDLRFSGQIDLDRLHPPRLGDAPEFDRRFRIHDETVRSRRTDDYVEFRYTLRPRHVGIQEVPRLWLPWLDRTTASVAMVTTPALPLRVLPAAETPSAHPPTPPIADDRIADTATRIAPAPLRDDMDGWHQPVAWADPTALFLAALGPLAFLASLFLTVAADGIRKSRVYLRHRLAARRFTRRIKRLQRTPLQSTATTALSAYAAVQRFLCDRSGIRMNSRTPADIWNALGAHSPPIMLSAQCRHAVEACFNACYAPPPNHPHDARPWLDKLLHDVPSCMSTQHHVRDNAAKPIPSPHSDFFPKTNATRHEPAFSSGSFHPAHRSRPPDHPASTPPAIWGGLRIPTAIAIMLLGLIGASTRFSDRQPSAIVDEYTLAHLWFEAQHLAWNARNQAERRTAINAYHQLQEFGVTSPALLYNRGTLHLINGNHSAAITDLRRAARFQGDREDVRHNLRLAISGWTAGPIPADRREHTARGALEPIATIWWRIPFVWRVRAMAALLSIVYLCAMARSLDKMPILR